MSNRKTVEEKEAIDKKIGELIRVCPTCFDQFLSNRRKRVYCSVKCQPESVRKVVNYKRQIKFQLRFQILTRDGFKCRYCGRTAEDGIELHVDHILAKVNGGTNEPYNLISCCNECNIGKTSSLVLAGKGQLPSFLTISSIKRGKR